MKQEDLQKHARLRQAIDAALELIASHGVKGSGRPKVPAASLASLLEQCRADIAIASQEQVHPVRLLHHFACTGGTIISKCLATMPNAVLLSEIDPLSQRHSGNARFSPTDLIKQLRYSRYPADEQLIAEMFLASLGVLQNTLVAAGQRLIIRDHPHSHFNTEIEPDQRPTIREIIARNHPVRSVITLRHPLASYLSLTTHRWITFAPATLEEYARRYITFLDRHADCPTLRYEEFAQTPEPVLERLCELLEMTYVPGSPAMAAGLALSGDSGRASDEIAPRPNRSIPPDIAAEIPASPSYHLLCERLNYDPSFR